jgi:hypothetical protein
LEQDVPDNGVSEADEGKHCLAGKEMGGDGLKGLKSEVSLLHFNQFVHMVLQLVVSQLLQVLWTQNHMLNQLGDLLMELG